MATKNQRTIQNKKTEQPRRSADNDGRKGKFNSMLLPILIGLAFFSIIFINRSNGPKEIEWKQLNEMLQSHEIEKIIIVNQTFAEIYIKKQ